MCLSVFLLTDRPLPIPPDQTVYPHLKLYPLEEEYQPETFAGIRRVAPVAMVYLVSPAGYCGCHFGYESSEEFQAHMADRAANPNTEYANTAEQAEAMWRRRTDAVKSLGRYLADHPDARLALYAVWENHAGQKDPVRATVPPSYFDGPGFDRLPEDVLLSVVPEPPGGEALPWDPAARRTHEWLGCGS